MKILIFFILVFIGLKFFAKFIKKYYKKFDEGDLGKYGYYIDYWKNYK